MTCTRTGRSAVVPGAWDGTRAGAGAGAGQPETDRGACVRSHSCAGLLLECCAVLNQSPTSEVTARGGEARSTKPDGMA